LLAHPAVVELPVEVRAGDRDGAGPRLQRHRERAARLAVAGVGERDRLLRGDREAARDRVPELAGARLLARAPEARGGAEGDVVVALAEELRDLVVARQAQRPLEGAQGRRGPP